MNANVSVIIPCFRCSNTIGRAIESIVNQSLLPNEIILIDDASGDMTLSILYGIQAKYAPDFIKVYSFSENGGPSKARNFGWSMAKSKYIAFLDSDDTWHVDKIKIQYSWMEVNPDVVLTGHGCDVLNDEINSKCIDFPGDGDYIGKYNILSKNHFVTPTVMVKSNIPFRMRINGRFSEDYFLWLEIILSGYLGYKFKNSFAYMHKLPYGDKGLSANLVKIECGELLNFYHLFKNGKIGYFDFFMFSCFSVLKFLRRVVLVFLRKFSFK